MRVAIATAQVPFVRGGAELLAENLLQAVRAAGHEAEIVAIPFKWYPASRIPEHMLAAQLMQVEESCGTPIDRLIGLKFPAYLIHHRHKRLWLLHQHRSAYDLWDAPFADLARAPDGAHVRSAISSADNAMLRDCSAVYTISGVVSDRLRRFNGVASQPLHHPPPGADRLRWLGEEDYVLAPSRLNESKRQLLAIEALALTTQPVRLCFIGAADAPEYERQTRARCAELGLDDRVAWRGGVSDADRLHLYGNCLAVLFCPVDEDYGYVTLEAMLCAKPVLTTTDAGGPLDFVTDGHTGLVCDPTPAAMAAALDRLWADRTTTAGLGRAGRDHYHRLALSWPDVVDRLLA